MKLIDADAIEYEEILVPGGDGVYKPAKVAYKDQIENMAPPKWESQIVPLDSKCEITPPCPYDHIEITGTTYITINNYNQTFDEYMKD